MALFVPGLLFLLSRLGFKPEETFSWTGNGIESIIRKIIFIVGGLMTLSFGMSYIYPTVWSVYFCSLISGFGEATIWVAQGPELLENSNDDNIGLNSSIFWFMYQEQSLTRFIRDYLRLTKPEVLKLWKSLVNSLATFMSSCHWKMLTIFLIECEHLFLVVSQEWNYLCNRLRSTFDPHKMNSNNNTVKSLG